MKIKYTLLMFSFILPFAILAFVSRVCRYLVDRIYNKKYKEKLGKLIENELGINDRQISYVLDKKSEVEVVISTKKYVVHLKQIRPRLIIHELQHIKNGTADESNKLNWFWGIQFNMSEIYHWFSNQWTKSITPF